MEEEKDWFEKLVREAFGIDEAEEKLSEEELEEIREKREEWKEKEEEVLEITRSAREDLKTKLDNEVLPPGISFEWENEI